MSRSWKLLAASLVMLGAPLSAAPASAAAAVQRSGQFTAATTRAITSIVVSGMGSAGIPGMSVGIWVPGKGTYVRTFGTADALTGKPLTLADHFRIASITKTFTATAILQLADQKRLKLSAHLSSFVKGIPDGNRITMTELLNMTAGVYDYTNDPTFLRDYFLGHNGAILGYTSAMFYLPSRKATIVLLGNNSGLTTTVTTTIFVALAAYLFPGQFPSGP